LSDSIAHRANEILSTRTNNWLKYEYNKKDLTLGIESNALD